MAVGKFAYFVEEWVFTALRFLKLFSVFDSLSEEHCMLTQVASGKQCLIDDDVFVVRVLCLR